MSGERIRNFHLLRELGARGWRLRLFSLVQGPGPSPQEVRELEALCDQVVMHPLDVSSPTRFARIIRNLVTSRAFQSDFFFSQSAAARLSELVRAGRPDVVVAGQLYMYPYVDPDLHGRTVLDALNVESHRVRAMSGALGFSPRGLVARAQAGPVEAFEREAVRSVAKTVAVSPEEAAYFELQAPGKIALVPNGVDSVRLRPRTHLPAAPQLLFVGSMDYSANVDAVGYLVDDVLPHLRRRDVVVKIVGSNPRRAVYRAARRSSFRVEVEGQVPDTRPYFESSRLLVVPLRYGGGTRLKILEALSLGVPVVSTTIGSEGLGLGGGKEILVADDPADLAASIERLLQDDDRCLELAREGRRTVETRFDWRALGSEFERVLSGVAAAD